MDQMQTVEEPSQQAKADLNRHYMREALKLVINTRPPCLHESATFRILILYKAESALAEYETPVGCVFVFDGKMIGKGKNGTNRSLNVRVPYYMFFLP